MIGYVIGLHCPYQGYTGTMYVLAKLTEVMRFIKKVQWGYSGQGSRQTDWTLWQTCDDSTLMVEDEVVRLTVLKKSVKFWFSLSAQYARVRMEISLIVYVKLS